MRATTGKVLFDFADIESYDPAGNYYPNGSDACEWCDDWCAAHPGDCANLPTRARIRIRLTAIAKVRHCGGCWRGWPGGTAVTQ